MKPRILDYLFLLYATILFTLPILLVTGYVTPAEAAALSLAFPSGLFLLALTLIIVKSFLRNVDLDFGLTGARWACILALMLPLAHFGFALQTVLRFSAHPIFAWERVLTPSFAIHAFSFAAILYAILACFFDFPMGPAKRIKRTDK